MSRGRRRMGNIGCIDGDQNDAQEGREGEGKNVKRMGVVKQSDTDTRRITFRREISNGMSGIIFGRVSSVV